MSPTISSNSTSIRQLNEELSSVHRRAQEMQNKLLVLQPSIEVKREEKGMRESLVEFIMDQWNSNLGLNYLTITTLNRIFEEKDETVKLMKQEFSQLCRTVGKIESEYLLKAEYIKKMKTLATRDEVEQCNEMLKSLPTYAGMEQRFQNLRDLLDTEVAKIKKDCLSEKKFKQEK